MNKKENKPNYTLLIVLIARLLVLVTIAVVQRLTNIPLSSNAVTFAEFGSAAVVIIVCAFELANHIKRQKQLEELKGE